jgi:hypothetical protein
VGPSSSHLERHGIQRTAPSSIVPWLSNLAGYEFQNTDFIGFQRYRLKHIRGAPYHPMTQGKIERYHRSMKNVVKLQTFYFPWELEQAIEGFVTYYNNARYPEFTAKRVREWLERLDVRPPAPATTLPNTTQYEWVGLTKELVHTPGADHCLLATSPSELNFQSSNFGKPSVYSVSDCNPLSIKNRKNSESTGMTTVSP